jgi:sterol desaturase/sphingolipid hydroxylase (fatty acid hydroxylase superfamily)
MVFPVVVYINGWLYIYYDHLVLHSSLSKGISTLPMLVRIALYLLVGDFNYYLVHRFIMHSKPLWRTHKWHHSPNYMYWLAGTRATLQHEFLVSGSFVLAAPILYPSPWWVYTALVILAYLTVDWMHLNVPWGGTVLEWFFVTPRYHHVHHSCDPKHYNFNMGNMFTFWDRLFGTYVDPDTLHETEMAFGIDDSPGLVRLVAGV